MTEDTITIQAHEIEGLAEIVELELGSSIELPSTVAGRRAYLANLTQLVDAAEALDRAQPGEAVAPPRSLALLEAIQEGSGNAPERFGEAIQTTRKQPQTDCPR